MWAMQYLVCTGPRQFVSSGGLGTMGFGLPAAVGARAARPDATVVCVDGDGSFQMTAQELATAVAEDLPVVVVVVNNGFLGMVRQWQDRFHGGRRSASELTQTGPDLAALARAYGCDAAVVESPDELGPAFDAALAARRPFVLDCRCDGLEECFPMLPPGAAGRDVVEWEGAGATVAARLASRGAARCHSSVVASAWRRGSAPRGAPSGSRQAERVEHRAQAGVRLRREVLVDDRAGQLDARRGEPRPPGVVVGLEARRQVLDRAPAEHHGAVGAAAAGRRATSTSAARATATSPGAPCPAASRAGSARRGTRRRARPPRRRPRPPAVASRCQTRPGK